MKEECRRAIGIDEAALITALENGDIKGAGLDVFAEEPLPPESKLWGMDNVLVTSHYSGATPRYLERVLEIFLDNGQFKCNLTPHDLLQAYTPDPAVFGDAYIMEKVSTPAGWTTPLPNEDWSSGHIAMCQEFVTAVAERRPARADGRLGLDVTRVVYAAYLAAVQGRRVTL